MADAEPRRRARDEEVVAAIVRVILDEGTLGSQKLLAKLVNRHLARRGARTMKVTGERARVLAVRSGLVGVSVRARVDGPTPPMERCPVCRSKLRRTANRTLLGETAETGYRCTVCPWWTGRELRIPQRYVFQARVARAERGQVTFAPTKRERG